MITIVTVTRHRPHVLETCLNSVSEQSCRNIEHIVVDGGSDDETPEIISKLQSQNLIYIREPDSGIYDALNKGIRRASGDIIGILNSDDIFFDAEILARIDSTFRFDNPDLVYGNLNYVKPDNLTRVVRHWRAGEFRPEQLRLGWMPPHPTVFVRRSLFDEVGFYDTDFKIAADYDWLLRVFSKPNINAIYLPSVLVSMRTGGMSNGSLRQIFWKSYEDYRVIQKNRIGGFLTLFLKNFRKLNQYWVDRRR